MSTQATSGRHAVEANRQNKVKGVIAIVIILICGGYLAWLLRPVPAPVFQPTNDPATQWLTGFATLNAEASTQVNDFYKLLGRIGAQPTEDKQGIIINGTVPTAADLATLKAALGKVQPAVPLDWKVTVGR